MSIVRDDCEERQVRVDRMIDEFRKAQSRRLANANALNGDDRVVNPQSDGRPAAPDLAAGIIAFERPL